MAKTKTIAVAGKGGTGKTTLAALLVQLLSKRGPVLAIDADPSSNLHMCLGLPMESTVGQVREEAAKKVRSSDFQAGMSKANYLELGIRQTLVETQQVDLLAMGRPEGPGCYCAANNVLRGVIDQMAQNYAYVVIDNEAGMEHISRQTTRDVDVLLLVSDPSIRGVVTAGRIKTLIQELRPGIGKALLVVNRVEGGLPEVVRKEVEKQGLELAGVIPVDRELVDLESSGEPLVKLSEGSPLRVLVESIAKKSGILE